MSTEEDALDWYLALQQNSRIDMDAMDDLMDVDMRVQQMVDGGMTERESILAVYGL